MRMKKTFSTASSATLALIAGALLMGLTVGVSAQDASPVPSACPSPSPLASMSPEPSDSPWPIPSASPSASSGTDEACGSGDGSAGVPAIVTVEAGEYWFDPSELTVDSATPTTLRLVGVGQMAHNLTITDLGIQLNVGPGTRAEATLSDLPPGTYPFFCAIYGHARAGMVGTLIVE
jgi:plastocyanin